MATFSGANLVTASSLTAWMQTQIGNPNANADQWCYGMGQLISGGYTCPAPELFGFTGANRFATVDAQTFLTQLNQYLVGGKQQTTAVTSPAVNRGSTTAGTPVYYTTTGGVNTGVSNPVTTASAANGTNNWMIILLLAVAAFIIIQRKGGSL